MWRRVILEFESQLSWETLKFERATYMETHDWSKKVNKNKMMSWVLFFPLVKHESLSLFLSLSLSLSLHVLYFLSTVFVGIGKTWENAPSMEKFFLRTVPDQELRKTFPWGKICIWWKSEKHFLFGGQMQWKTWSKKSYLWRYVIWLFIT